jgi:hypothetical protein
VIPEPVAPVVAEGDVATPTGRIEDSPPSERKAVSLTAICEGTADRMLTSMDSRDQALARKLDQMLARIRG